MFVRSRVRDVDVIHSDQKRKKTFRLGRLLTNHKNEVYSLNFLALIKARTFTHS